MWSGRERPRSSEWVSFVGVVFESSIVARVEITSGQRALGADVQDLSDGGNLDLVVMDDYLYAEPQPIP
jgi:hypothetical protein